VILWLITKIIFQFGSHFRKTIIIQKAIGKRELTRSISYDNQEAFSALVSDKRTDVNIPINDWNPLMMAVAKNNKEMVSALLERGADLDYKNSNGHNALDIAKEEQNSEIEDLIVREMSKRESESKKSGIELREAERVVDKSRGV
jgi:ankyrin repeat protein